MYKSTVEVLDNIPFNLKHEQVIARLWLRQKSGQVENMVEELIGQVQPVVRPKAIYRVSWVDSKTPDGVEIDGAKFTSRVLRANMDKVERVFPYIATCGVELEKIRIPDADVLKTYCLDVIKLLALGTAIAFMSETVKKKYALGQTSHMNPGSLEDWPLTQQKQLFSLFENAEQKIGVRLTESLVMYPLKSSSGIYFTSEIRFESCQLCPREKCIGRRATYSAELAGKYLGK